MSKAAEKFYHEEDGMLMDQFEMAEAYYRFRVKAITDEMIDATGYGMSIKIERKEDKAQANAYAQGMKDFKQILLK